MKDNKNMDFLNTIYKTSEMGIIGIDDVFDKASKEEFRNLLNEQKDDYNEILQDAIKLYTAYGMEEKELNALVKMNSKVMSEMKLMTNSSDETIAKMMMEGTNKGIIKINKTMNENPDADEEAVKLAKKLLKIMEHNMKDLKIYL